MQSIPVQEAVKNAKKSLLELYADDPPKALALEEIEFVNDGGRLRWSDYEDVVYSAPAVVDDVKLRPVVEGDRSG